MRRLGNMKRRIRCIGQHRVFVIRVRHHAIQHGRVGGGMLGGYGGRGDGPGVVGLVGGVLTQGASCAVVALCGARPRRVQACKGGARDLK